MGTNLARAPTQSSGGFVDRMFGDGLRACEFMVLETVFSNLLVTSKQSHELPLVAVALLQLGSGGYSSGRPLVMMLV